MPLRAALFFSCALVGCEDIESFRTRPGEVFHGEVIGSDRAGAAPSFIREGFESHTEMELTFDPEAAATIADAGAAGPPPIGTLHTYQCPPDTDLCAERRRTSGHFDHAPLESIRQLATDVLSQYDFPGGGRLRNYIFGARFESTVEAQVHRRNAMVFVSLMENGRMEVRVIAASVLDGTGAELAPPLFGVFTLERKRP
jgi:hypothetical protein